MPRVNLHTIIRREDGRGGMPHQMHTALHRYTLRLHGNERRVAQQRKGVALAYSLLRTRPQRGSFRYLISLHKGGRSPNRPYRDISEHFDLYIEMGGRQCDQYAQYFAAENPAIGPVAIDWFNHGTKQKQDIRRSDLKVAPRNPQKFLIAVGTISQSVLTEQWRDPDF